MVLNSRFHHSRYKDSKINDEAKSWDWAHHRVNAAVLVEQVLSGFVSLTSIYAIPYTVTNTVQNLLSQTITQTTVLFSKSHSCFHSLMALASNLVFTFVILVLQQQSWVLVTFASSNVNSVSLLFYLPCSDFSLGCILLIWFSFLFLVFAGPYCVYGRQQNKAEWATLGWRLPPRHTI